MANNNKYYLIHCDTFKKGYIRKRLSWMDVQNFVTMLHNMGLEGDFVEDPDQGDEDITYTQDNG